MSIGVRLVAQFVTPGAVNNYSANGGIEPSVMISKLHQEGSRQGVQPTQSERVFQNATHDGQSTQLPLFPRTPYPGDLLWTGRDTVATPEHEKILVQTLEQIYATRAGREALGMLRRQQGETPPIFIASAEQPDWFKNPQNLPRLTMPTESEGVANIFVNTPELLNIFKANSWEGGRSPAHALRDVYNGTLRAALLRVGTPTASQKPRTVDFANEIWVAASGDQFYGELLGQYNVPGFNYRLPLVLSEGNKTKLTRQEGWILKEDVSDNVLDLADNIPPDWVKPYEEVVAEMASMPHIPKGMRLGFELMYRGGEAAPIRVVLSALDTRIDWSPVERFNRRLPEDKKFERNSLTLLHWVRRLESSATEDYRAELAEGIKARPKAAGRRGLGVSQADSINGVGTRLRELVTSGQYSGADVADMTRGLHLPEPLQRVIRELIEGGRQPSGQLDSQTFPKTVAKLQSVPAAN